MAIVVHRFPAAQILRVSVLGEGRANVPFLNWKVGTLPMGQRNAARDAFAGAGVYGVCFDDRLIYIGSFLGSGGVKVEGTKEATFDGDIAKGRWWQHFGSIVGRSHKLHVAPGTSGTLSNEFGPAHPMVAAFQAAPQDILCKDAGCLGASERLRFAARHLVEFIGEEVEPAHVLARFCYVHVRIDALPAGMSAAELSRWIEHSESSLIETLHPEVNTAGRIFGPAPVRVDCAQVGTTILASLHDVQPAPIG